VWPEVALHLAMLAKLAAAEGRMGEASAAAQAGVAMLTLTLPASRAAAITSQVGQLRRTSANMQASCR
jgi:hypothetical protein